jgi:hypothetical protein
LVPSNSWPSWYNEDVPDIANKILPLWSTSARRSIQLWGLSKAKVRWLWFWSFAWKNHYWKPWQDLAIDLIGPWKIPINNRTYEFNALTAHALIRLQISRISWELIKRQPNTHERSSSIVGWRGTLCHVTASMIMVKI